jgi:hypothetical protein
MQFRLMDPHRAENIDAAQLNGSYLLSAQNGPLVFMYIESSKHFLAYLVFSASNWDIFLFF